MFKNPYSTVKIMKLLDKSLYNCVSVSFTYARHARTISCVFFLMDDEVYEFGFEAGATPVFYFFKSSF